MIPAAAGSALGPAADWRAPYQGRATLAVLIGALVFNAASASSTPPASRSPAAP